MQNSQYLSIISEEDAAEQCQTHRAFLVKAEKSYFIIPTTLLTDSVVQKDAKLASESRGGIPVGYFQVNER